MSTHTSYMHSPVPMQVMVRLFLLVMSIAILCGCSSTTLIRPVSTQDGISYSNFNKEMQSLQLTVEFIDQRSFIAREIQVASDSTWFLDVRTDAMVSVPTLHIKEVRVQDHASGRSRGVLFGAVVGGIVGLGAVTGFHLVGEHWAPVWNYAFGGGATVVGILVGGLTGGAIGSAVGYTRHFVIAGDSLRVK